VQGPTRLEPGQVVLLGEDELRMAVADDEPEGGDGLRPWLLGGAVLGALLIAAGLWLYLSG